MVKTNRDPLFRNQHVNLDLCTVFVRILRFMCAQTFCKRRGKCSASSLLMAFLVKSCFLLRPSRFFIPFTASISGISLALCIISFCRIVFNQHYRYVFCAKQC